MHGRDLSISGKERLRRCDRWVGRAVALIADVLAGNDGIRVLLLAAGETCVDRQAMVLRWAQATFKGFATAYIASHPRIPWARTTRRRDGPHECARCLLRNEANALKNI